MQTLFDCIERVISICNITANNFFFLSLSFFSFFTGLPTVISCKAHSTSQISSFLRFKNREYLPC